jgi:hypothetical protein
MSSNAGNAAAGTIFFLIIVFSVNQFYEYYGGLHLTPLISLVNQWGITNGECIIIGLIIGIVFVWSACQFIALVLEVIGEAIFFIYNNERIRNFTEVMERRANQTIGRKLRRIIRDIRRDMKGKESL